MKYPRLTILAIVLLSSAISIWFSRSNYERGFHNGVKAAIEEMERMAAEK